MSSGESWDSQDPRGEARYYGPDLTKREKQDMWLEDIFSLYLSHSSDSDLLIQVCRDIKKERDDAEARLDVLEPYSRELEYRLDRAEEEITELQGKITNSAPGHSGTMDEHTWLSELQFFWLVLILATSVGVFWQVW